MSHGTSSILDAPTPWMSQLMFLNLDKHSKQCLLSTCKTFRDFSLGQAERVRCQLGTNRTAAAAAISLQLLSVCRKEAEVTLVLQDDAKPPNSHEFSVWLRTLCSHASIAPGLPLHRVTCVELQGDLPGDMVYSELTLACPNMRHLVRQSFSCNIQNQVFAPMACAQLQKLTIHRLRLLSAWQRDEQSISQFKKQLCSLPNLRDIDFTVGDDVRDTHDGDVRCLVDSIKCHCHQLKSLRIFTDITIQLTQLFSSSWPQLRALRLPQYQLEGNDCGLIYRQAPQLEELEVGWLGGFMSMSQQQGRRLQVLKVTYVYMQELACTDLGTLQTLITGQLCLGHGDRGYIDKAVARLASLPHVKPGWLKGTLAVDISFCELDYPVPALLPLLRLIPFEALMLTPCPPLGEAWLKLLAALECHTLLLTPNALPVPSWAVLLVHVPHLHTLHLMFDKEAVPDVGVICVQLCTLCMTSPRPISLRLGQSLVRHLGASWRTLQAVCLPACGKQCVTLEMVDDVALDLE